MRLKNNYKIFPACFIVLTLSWCFSAYAQNLKIFVNSGTGFFVNRSGYFVTNLHVVSQCQRIVVRGAVSARYAKIIGRDVKHDLALLKVDGMVGEFGAFRVDSMPVEKGERVVVVGYPGEAYKTLKTVTREAEIISTKGPQGENTWLQLSDLIEQGNSGGPLMDAYGNVIGVIVAKAVIYTYAKSDPENGTYTNSGVAIAAPVVRKFLDTHRVSYTTADANSTLGTDRLSDKAQRFVVSVRCETPTEVR